MMKFCDDFLYSEWSNVSFESFPDIPTMISNQERRYLYWITSNFYKGEGRVVEAGTWLGGSTACLASGLEEQYPSEILTCFDNFVWMKTYENKSNGIRMDEGADFHPHFRKFIYSKFDNVRSFKRQLSEIQWIDGQIEILFLDAPKNKDDMLHSIKTFFPYLIPGDSTIVFQDFFYAPAYEVPATILSLNDVLQLVHVVANSSTASFRFCSPIDLELSPIDYSVVGVDIVAEKFLEMIDMLPSQAGDFLSVSLAFMLHDHGFQREALSVIKSRSMTDIGLRRYRFYSSLGYLKSKYGALLNLK